MLQRHTYLSLALTTLLLVGFLATSVASYWVTRGAFSQRIVEDSLPLTSDNIYSEIERDLLRSILISSLMAHDTFVRDWALGGEQEPARIIRYLKQIQGKYDTTTAFFVAEASRRYYHPDGVLKTVSKGDPGDAWYFRVRELETPYEINIDHDTADPSRVSIFINYRVNDYHGRYIGVTGIGLAMSEVNELIESYQRRYGRLVYFADREGRVTVRGSGYEGAERLQDRRGLGRHAGHILANPGVSVHYRREDGTRVFVNTRLLPEFDWFLVVEQAGSEAEARVLTTLMANVLVALAITALVLTLGYFTVRGYQRRLREMATTDRLTGAANRHLFEPLFRQVTSAAQRRGEAVTLLTLDLDHFKAVNDHHGHPAGDAVLRELAALARGHIRESDTLCRWGGDEFLILMAGCDRECGRVTAEKLRDAVSRYPFRFNGRDLPVAVTMGVAEHRPGEGLEALVARADRALYAAKAQGRDRVVAE